MYIQFLIIVAFFQNTAIRYTSESLSVCLCVFVFVFVYVCFCVCMCVCARICGFLHNNSKSNQSRNMKFKCIALYENSSVEFSTGHYQIKVKVIVGVQIFTPYTAIKNCHVL